MAKNSTVSKELKGLGADLAVAVKTMVRSEEFKNLEKEILSSVKSIAKNVGSSLKVAQKSAEATVLKRRLKRVARAGKVEGRRQAARAQAEAVKGIQQARVQLKKFVAKRKKGKTAPR